jgi:hypothetical protein
MMNTREQSNKKKKDYDEYKRAVQQEEERL